MMRLGVVGCGNISLRYHLPACLQTEGVEVVAAADPTPARLDAFRQSAGLDAEACFSDAEDLLASSEVDAVLVATPPSFRPPIVLRALGAGKHVLSEKPIALAPADGWAMVDAAQAAGRYLAMVHNYYFMPEYVAIKDILERGVIGRPYLVTLNFLGVEDRPGAAEYQPVWRHDARMSGGGVLMDMLHAMYILPWLMDQPIRSVSAATDRRLAAHGAVEDVALCRFQFDSGFGLINMAWGDGPGGIEVMGTNGRLLLFYEGYGTGPFSKPAQLHVYQGAERVPIELELAPSLGVGGVWRNFVRSVAGDEEPLATGQQGCAALETVLAAYASAARQRTVELPLEHSDPVFTAGVAGLTQGSAVSQQPSAISCTTRSGPADG
jgi:predicted dehydrogenase